MLYSNNTPQTTEIKKNKVITAMPTVKKHSRRGKLQAATEVESRGVCTARDQPQPLRDAPSSEEKLTSDSLSKENPNKENPPKGKSSEIIRAIPLRDHNNSVGGGHRHLGGHRRHSRQELDPSSRGTHGGRTQELVSETSTSTKQEIFQLAIARQALEAEKAELKRLLDQRENIITELRKQMHHREKTIQAQRAQFEDAIRNIQNGKRIANIGDSSQGRSSAGGGISGGGGGGGGGGGSGGSGGTREELQLVRDAIISLRSNFRGTDPNQHTLDTLEQAIAVLIERCGGVTSGSGSGGGGGNSSGGVSGMSNGVLSGNTDKATRPNDKRPQVNGVVEPSTKVIYFTERTVTPFMSTINKRLGDIRLRDFKNMFDRPGLFRFHFKSHDPEYGMVKEEILNDDDILPGVEGKIIAWVEEDSD